jgi:hypothetical protein
MTLVKKRDPSFWLAASGASYLSADLCPSPVRRLGTSFPIAALVFLTPTLFVRPLVLRVCRGLSNGCGPRPNQMKK